MKKIHNENFEAIDVKNVIVGGMTMYDTTYTDCDGGTGKDVYDEPSGEWFFKASN